MHRLYHYIGLLVSCVMYKYCNSCDWNLWSIKYYAKLLKWSSSAIVLSIMDGRKETIDRNCDIVQDRIEKWQHNCISMHSTKKLHYSNL